MEDAIDVVLCEEEAVCGLNLNSNGTAALQPLPVEKCLVFVKTITQCLELQKELEESG